MNKRLLVFWIFTLTLFVVNGQTFFSEQEENLIYYSPDIAPTAVCVGDIDDDGDQDILSFFNKKFRLYEHSDGVGTFNEQEIISAPDDWILSVFLSDLNGDGKQDILASSYNNDKIIWYENEGETFSSQKSITDSTKGAMSVYAADLDNDGDNDVLSASLWDNKIAWYENNGEGVFGEQQVITMLAEGARYVYVSDLNGDGFQDVLSASIYDNKIAWYENKGGGTFGEQKIITESVARALCIYTADMNGDGSQDVLSASSWDNKIAWYKNDGQGNFGEQHVISEALDKAQSVYAADLDKDGDLDVLSASLLDNKIAWYENMGLGNFGDQLVVTNSADMPGFVYALDVDKDGYQDIVSASTDFKITWYENTLPMNIVSSPKDTSVYPNQNVVFGIVADSVKIYQWQFNSGENFIDLINNEVYVGVNTNTLEITGVTFDLQKNKYRCVTINGADSLNSKIAVLTIKDTVNPLITSVHPDTFLLAEAGCFATMPDFTNNVEATDNSYETVDITQTPLPWSLVSGSAVEIILTAKDPARNSSHIKFNVDVVDQTPPVFHAELGTQDLNAGDNGHFILPDFTDKVDVFDNCSMDSAIIITQQPAANYVVPDSIFKIGVTLIATDEVGNSSQFSFEAIAKDTIAPQITSVHNNLALEATYQCEANLPNFRGEVMATDNFDKFSELYIQQSPAPFTFISGKENKVTMTVTDKAKNSSEIIFNVEVKDFISPILTCPQNQIINIESGKLEYTAAGNEFDPISIGDNCEIVSVTNNINDYATLSQVAFPLDTTNVVWTVADGEGNSAYCSFNVIVNKTVGIETIKNQGISVYPNPTTGEVYFESGKPIQTLRVLDLTGKILIEKKQLPQTGKINISGFTSGRYIISIKTDEKEFNLPIVKE